MGQARLGACRQGSGPRSGAIPLQAEWHQLQVGMIPLLPVLRLR